MPLPGFILLGLAAGLHGALYGAYKDSPHESFLMRRFVREIVFAVVLAAALWAFSNPAFAQSPVVVALTQLNRFLRPAHEQSAFVLYLSIFALTRIFTEWWKLFVRVEPQVGYRIPTQMHWVRGVIHNRLIRFLMGIGWLASMYGLYALFTLIPRSLPPPVHGAVVGLSIGLFEAMAGAYKDGSIEGFYWRKFVKSPSFGFLGGLIASGHTTHVGYLMLSSIGSMRMFLELLYKMLRTDYTPGKFRSLVGPFPRWVDLRRRFIVPYAATWVLYVVLCSHPDW